MATLHLPKNRPPRKEKRPEDRAERALEAGLKGTFPPSDAVAATIPGDLAKPPQTPEHNK